MGKMCWVSLEIDVLPELGAKIFRASFRRLKVIFFFFSCEAKKIQKCLVNLEQFV